MLFPAIPKNMRGNNAYYIALQVYTAGGSICLRYPKSYHITDNADNEEQLTLRQNSLSDLYVRNVSEKF